MVKLRFFSRVIVLAIVASALFFTGVASAAQTNGTVNFRINPIDVCPNIPGAQPSVPGGMVIDADGNCYTPGPTVVDLCSNLTGVQTTIPSGYYRTSDGNCFPRPITPPVVIDVCPNLPDTQEILPDDFYLDSDTGFCLPIIIPPDPPVLDRDVCLNLSGNQKTTPEGMENDRGYCFFPPVAPTTPPLKNVPEIFQPFVRFFVDLVPESVRDFFRGLPDEVVGGIPLYTFLIALVFALIPILQSIREYFYKRRLMAFYAREKSIAEEKDNFITLASHYLRTPITIMGESVPLMAGAGDITPTKATEVTDALRALSKKISSQLDIADPALGIANTPVIKPKPFWQSGFFWLPIALSIILTIVVNFFIGVVGDKEIGIGNAAVQLLIVVAFIVALYLIVRNYHIQKKLRQEKKDLITREQAIDAVRNEFIDQQTANVSEALSTLYFASAAPFPSKAYNLYTDGLMRLGKINDKFVLLAHIKTGANRNASSFDVKALIDRAILAEQENIAAKKLTVQNAVESAAIIQNEPLFSFVISSVLDNAIKFANTGGRIHIASQPRNKTISVKISDNGRGIDPDKVNQLFKPFSRAESAVNFSYEGLGLSLFLNRLILTYTGGEISAAPRPAGGTDVAITTPVDINVALGDMGK